MTITIEPVEGDVWQRLAAGFEDHNYRQLWDFGTACARRAGAISEHVAIWEENELLGLSDVRVKRLPVLGTGIAYVNGGPLIRMANRRDRCQRRLHTALESLVGHYVRDRKLVLRIQPPVIGDSKTDYLSEAFQNAGYAINEQHPHYRTILLDISLPLNDIRKQFAQKWRNCLNNAERQGVTIETSTDGKAFSTFLELFNTLLARKGFDTELHASFYEEVQHGLSDGEKFQVSLAFKEEQPIAGHVSSMLGDTCVYLLGATNELGLKRKAAYLLQWSVIQTAKKRSCRWYDLGGIDPEKNPGVYHFKRGMGGVDVTAPGPFEKAPSQLAWHTVTLCEKIYRQYQRMRCLCRTTT